MSIKKRNILSIIMVLCIVIGSMIPCFAWENVANLSTDEPWKFSAYCQGPNSKAYIIKGATKSYNAASSKHSVYFIHAVYDKANQDKRDYSQDVIKLVEPGSHITANIGSTGFATKKYFRLLLNPYGSGVAGCTAKGTQRDTL